jgi:hypothetical protein
MSASPFFEFRDSCFAVADLGLSTILTRNRGVRAMKISRKVVKNAASLSWGSTQFIAWQSYWKICRVVAFFRVQFGETVSTLCRQGMCGDHAVPVVAARDAFDAAAGGVGIGERVGGEGGVAARAEGPLVDLVGAQAEGFDLIDQGADPLARFQGVGDHFVDGDDRDVVDDRLIEHDAAAVGAVGFVHHAGGPQALPLTARLRMRSIHIATGRSAMLAGGVHRLAQLRNRHDVAAGRAPAAGALGRAGALLNRELHRINSSARGGGYLTGNADEQTVR